MKRGEYAHLVIFKSSVATTNDHGDEELTWSEIERAYARVRFGTAQEKRDAAQEYATQSATFEVRPTSALLGVRLKDQIEFDGSDWDITEAAPLDRKNLRFTAVRSR